MPISLSSMPNGWWKIQLPSSVFSLQRTSETHLFILLLKNFIPSVHERNTIGYWNIGCTQPILHESAWITEKHRNIGTLLFLHLLEEGNKRNQSRFRTALST